MFDDTLHFLANHLEAPDWARLGEHLPYEWIQQAVVSTEGVSIRHRRLPAEQVIWLMVALALYRHKSISEVLDDLGLALPDSKIPFVSKSAAAQARQRVGPEPLKGNAKTLCRPKGEETPLTCLASIQGRPPGTD